MPMLAEEFTAEVDTTAGGPVVALRGTVNKESKDDLESAYRIASEQSGEILLDFADVDYINSTGIAVIVGVLAMARAEGRKVAARGLNDHYREVFSITRLSDFIHMYEDSPSGN
jgi:anti-anti-sigma factor